MSNDLSNDLSRRGFLALVGAANLVDNRVLSKTLLMAREKDGVHFPPPGSVVRGNVRFQILSPTVIRMEYAPSGHFIDALSVAVVNRNWPTCAYEVHDKGEWVEIATSRMQVRYKVDSGMFTPSNLAVSWTDPDGAHTWKPGDVDDKNLGGAPGDIQDRRYPGSEPGPLSRNGYFCLDDSQTAVWNAVTDWPEPRPNREGAQDWYVFVYGRDYAGCLRELAQLLGPIPLVPRYVFGAWFGSRAGYPADEQKRIVHHFREEGVPFDLLYVDCDSSSAVVWAGFSWDPEQLPNPKEFFAWMKARGVKVSVNEHYAAITPGSDVHFDQFRQALGLPADTKEIPHDLANKKYAQLYMDMLHKPALDMGMAFWQQDGFAETKMVGLDPMMWTRHVEYLGEERLTGKRTMVLCRGGAWGSHRYGAFFSGDLIPYWTTLELLIPFSVQAGNMLVAYVANTLAYQETLDPELYQRLVQLAAFSPLTWFHSLWGVRQPWEYGDAGVATAKQALGLRYRLLPYIYTYSRIAHETGTSLVRGTWLEYPQQEKSFAFPHQYFFGQELLIAPITRPGAGKPVVKDVYLPEGEHWHDYFTGTIYQGGQVLPYACPLDRLPIFVRAGSILPMAPTMEFSDAAPVDPLTVEVFTGKAGTFRLYEDDGLSLDYRKHMYAWTPITYTPTTGGDHRITIGPATGRYAGQLLARRYRLLVHGVVPPASVRLGSRALRKKGEDDPAEGWVWDKAQRVLKIDLVQPMTVTEPVVVTLQQAGEFHDVVALQGVRAYRDRLWRVKLAVKLRWAMILSGDLMNKQPHILEEIERVEQLLNDTIDSKGVGLAAHPVDFTGMTAEILRAFVTQPFDTHRTIPNPPKNEDRETGAKKLAQGTFTPEELHQMTATLLDCQLVASAVGSPVEGNLKNGADDARPVLHARVVYDTASIGTPGSVAYELTLPDTGMPGWVEMSRAVQPDGSTDFLLRAPFPAAAGTYPIRVRATLTWGPNQAVVECVAPWVVPLGGDV